MSAAKIRILAVVRHPVGGIRTYLKYTYGSLDPKRFQFCFITVKSAESDVLKADLGGFEPEFIEVDAARAEWNLWRAVRRRLVLGGTDLIHSHGLTAGSVAVLANWGHKARHIITSHDVFRPEQFSGASGKIKKFLMAALLKEADVVHSVTESAERNLLDFLPSLGRHPEKLKVIQNGIHIGSTLGGLAQTASLRATLGLSPEEVLFGFFGRFMPQKGFEFIIDAVNELSEDPFFAGRFKVLAVNDGSYIREYREKVRSRGLGSYFLFHGFTPQAARLMSETDAVLMPSLWEACGLVAMEAMVSGSPLIATECEGLRDVLENSPALRIPARDAHAMADAMRSLISSTSAHKKAALDFADTARRRFDVRRSAAALEDLVLKTL